VRILSWNVNGLRAVLSKGCMDAVAREKPDVLCLQETRTREEQVGRVLEGLPFQHFSSTTRPGYSGTAVLTRIPPLSWSEGMGRRTSDAEGRVVTVEFASVFVVSAYAPNSQRGLPRLGYRLGWDRQFRGYVGSLAERKPVVFCGDMNVAHEEIDIARPRENRMNPGFTDEERRSFSRLLGAGFLDAFRALHPAEVRYTWWSYATRARERNIGWSIDYTCASIRLRGKIRDAFILDRVTGSDHCPVGIVLGGSS
jgi:exodeoxyribonuclease-3